MSKKPEAALVHIPWYRTAEEQRAYLRKLDAERAKDVTPRDKEAQQ